MHTNHLDVLREKHIVNGSRPEEGRHKGKELHVRVYAYTIHVHVHVGVFFQGTKFN